MDDDAILRLFGYNTTMLSGGEKIRALPIARGVAAGDISHTDALVMLDEMNVTRPDDPFDNSDDSALGQAG